jgi:hypothetical protein
MRSRLGASFSQGYSPRVGRSNAPKTHAGLFSILRIDKVDLAPKRLNVKHFLDKLSFYAGGSGEALPTKIAFYLAHQSEIDAYLKEGEREFEALRQQARESNPLPYRKLEEARQQSLATRK